ncbi:hypothetical protein BDR22DRAFT_855695 [Usnea florida]
MRVPLAVIAGPLGVRVWPAITMLLAARAMVAPAKVRWNNSKLSPTPPSIKPLKSNIRHLEITNTQSYSGDNVFSSRGFAIRYNDV